MIRPSKTNTLIGVVVLTGFMLLNFNFAAGEELNLNSKPSLNLNPLDAVNSAGIGGINVGDILEAFKFNFPFDPGKINIDTNIPISPKVNESQQILPDIGLKQFLTPKDISSDDLAGAIKAILTLVIQIFLVVISVTSQILKLILGFLR
ncbi:MAG: hypothetical protein A3J47_02400 [Candidatus Yanofskybacteria bacterium RIFCSPHIGHO2_02_FULL_43_22]|uniref:Uncharacterized protein n=1 Tax=Candidatus Yanofskybacteria bacterium RIFCSPHIGHO2_02_FULL_43_22 TaxID=1802681 RepID=A0A1F8FKU2_9BACT|nr:MAG: hypothetical protein A3J47_02400 [Candidatus Yanofskybacteria bacterium RIFCSPHIGHO2_02_FULL_43_22]